MDTKEKNLLKTFGFGLALLIPFVIMMHTIDLRAKGILLICLIAGVFFIISKVEQFKFPYFIVLLWVYLMLMGGHPKHPLNTISIAFLIFSVGILFVSIYNVQWLSGFYKLWMKVAETMGHIVSWVVLTIFFYFIFGVVGIVLRLLGKDVLDQRIEKEKLSYWKICKKQENEESYHRQF